MQEDESLTKQGTAGAAARRRPPAWQWALLVIVSLASLAVAGWPVYQWLSDRPAQRPSRPAPLRYASPGSAPAGTQPGATLGALLQGRGPARGDEAVDALLRGGAHRQPLGHNPAKLAPPPGAQRRGRFTQRGGQMTEEVGLWHVPGGRAQQIAEHYRTQAEQRGFRPIADSAAGDNAEAASQADAKPGRTLLFITHDPAKAQRILSVHLLKSPGGIHVTLWLRYATPAQPDKNP
jgi:hypothetical protein